jgi:hypothetical protein
MTKPWFWIAAILSLAGSPVLADEAEAEPAATAESCLATAIPTNQLFCFTKAAQAAGDVNLCLLADQPGAAWQCVAIYAEQAHDPSLCQVIPREDEAPRDLTRNLCRAHLALSWSEPELCDGLATPGLSDACLFELVQFGADEALCDRIGDPDLRSVCPGGSL